MAIQVTIDGRLTAQPEVRFSQAGKPWVTGTIVSNERRKNQAGDWEDANTTFLRFKMFGAQAEALANLSKGELVVATGKLVQNDYEDKDGNKRQSMELIVSTIGAVVRNTPATHTTPPAGGSGAAGWHNPSPATSQAVHGAPSGDPYAADMPASTPYGDGDTPF